MTAVRRAGPDDRDAVVSTIVAAFADDPAWSFIVAGEYDRLSRPFAGTLFDVRVQSGQVWMTQAATAVALWQMPGDQASGAAHADALWARYRDVAGPTAWARMTAYDRAVHAAAPDSPYWYLGVLATHPDHQGQGLATAVIAPVLAVADRAGLDCCLETSTTANRAFYARRGFTEATEVDVPDGPTTWWLRRPAVPAVA